MMKPEEPRFSDDEEQRPLLAEKQLRDTCLASTYPLGFGTDVKPVAIGVGKLIWPAAKVAGIKRRAPNDALSRRAASPAYLSALAAGGAMRVGLDGDAVEPVSLEHQVFALDRPAEIERRLAGEDAVR
jgi:sRNA-binding protein